jgi:hypothetical protein
VNGTIEGLTAILLAFVTGNAQFSGTVDGTDFTMTSYGQLTKTDGNCSYTWNVTLDGSLAGDAISGTVSYAPATNGNPDCAAIECSSIQDFSGSRPPK